MHRFCALYIDYFWFYLPNNFYSCKENVLQICINFLYCRYFFLVNLRCLYNRLVGMKLRKLKIMHQLSSSVRLQNSSKVVYFLRLAKKRKWEAEYLWHFFNLQMKAILSYYSIHCLHTFQVLNNCYRWSLMATWRSIDGQFWRERESEREHLSGNFQLCVQNRTVSLQAAVLHLRSSLCVHKLWVIFAKTHIRCDICCICKLNSR